MRTKTFVAALTVSLMTAPSALAGDNGEGIVGETDDKIITFFALGVIVFFVVLVIVASAVQGRLERRKQERKALELRRRVGW